VYGHVRDRKRDTGMNITENLVRDTYRYAMWLKYLSGSDFYPAHAAFFGSAKGRHKNPVFFKSFN